MLSTLRVSLARVPPEVVPKALKEPCPTSTALDYGDGNEDYNIFPIWSHSVV